MGALRRRVQLSDDRGAEVVEFAIVIPILLVVIAALISFGFVFMSQITLTQAAREGARYAAICKTDTTCLGNGDANVKQKIVDHAPGITINPGDINVSDCSADGATSATVTITYQWSIGIPPFGTTGLTLHGKASTPCGG